MLSHFRQKLAANEPFRKLVITNRHDKASWMLHSKTPPGEADFQFYAVAAPPPTIA
ncbi:hypothetical protein SAMN06298226_1964 [Nitrosovibrio sp. Nv4]|uniref:hypothetical protein n=1 Tax=Nitrosovibrio sp. Nv4 TaxID=1945880 RepID=UPI000BDB651B|nr:hypothetical protein [Nitrosovibrio sp. Nv4]SOD41662.1 hypothetical protein SAMN06298226_1964 [Nitrosovibrio sp. Nv4]